MGPSAPGPPTATYRLQLDPSQLDLTGAADLVSYLARLGVSHLYVSPIFAARPGSPHGYDVVDPRRLNPELGGWQGLGELVAALRRERLGLILDIVPNHMAAHHRNPWWMEVLRLGAEAPSASFFDIDWEAGPLLLPILGDHYPDVLERGELSLELEEGGFRLVHGDHRLPVSPASVGLILSTDVPAALRDRQEPAIWEAYRLRPEVRPYLEARLEAFARPGAMDGLIELQAYRPVFWQLSLERMSYRRFFDILHLVGVRQEDPSVFEATHTLLGRLAAEGAVQGVRVDHVDGLRDPLGYLVRLRSLLSRQSPPPTREREGGGPQADREGRVAERSEAGREAPYLVVEKILAPDEHLPEGWPVAGTTGYAFLDRLNRLFVAPEGLDALRRAYADFIGLDPDFEDLAYTQKRRIIRERLAAEFGRLGDRIARLAEADRQARDLAPSELHEALVETTACLPVYRTYLRDGPAAERDRGFLEQALAAAARRRPGAEQAFAFLARLLSLADDDPPPEWVEFVLDWQQYTGAVAAKGVEDTALYVYNPLVSLNEVGGDPGRSPDDPVSAFHRHNLQAVQRWPGTMTTASTHDTKRSEDVRARLNALSRMPDEWAARLARWSEMNRPNKRLVGGVPAPSPNEEVLLYQTLLGAWPLTEEEVTGFADRLDTYLVKAAREAKIHTRWIDPDPEHEEALCGFARAVLEDAAFLEDFRDLQSRVAEMGARNSLAQVVLGAAAPGVPDRYQGCELWDLSLADPDNRWPVDFELRRRLLEELRSRDGEPGLVEKLLGTWQDGRIKLYVVGKTLTARRSMPEVFVGGDYLPLEAPPGTVAFARRWSGRWALAVAVVGAPAPGRLSPPAGAPRRWRDLLTGREQDRLEVPSLLGPLPATLLVGDR